MVAGGPTTQARISAIRDLARQLASILSAHRLHPEDHDHPMFVAAADRVAEAARIAMAAGTIGYEVRAGHMRNDVAGALDDEACERLAGACYRRRVELLEVVGVPTTEDLAAFATLLSRAPDEVEEEGGAATLLAEAGVGSLRAHEVDPRAEVEEALAGLPDDLRRLWDQLRDPDRLAAELIVEGMADDPAAAASELHRRFEELLANVPEDLAARHGAHEHIHEALTKLPANVRREFLGFALGELEGEGFGAAHLDRLDDADLARALVEFARAGGPDLGDLIDRVGDRTGRGEALAEAARRLRAGHADDAAIEAEGSVADIADGPDRSEVRQDVADLIGRRLVVENEQDAEALRSSYPDGEADERGIGLAALRDYFGVDDDLERVSAVLDGWSQELRAAVAAGDAAQVRELMGVIGPAMKEPRRASRAASAARGALGIETISALLDSHPGGGSEEEVLAVLAPLGDIAARSIMALLAVDEDRGHRSRLVTLAAALTRNPYVFEEWVDDGRWFVARNLATILGRRQGRGEAAMLRRLARHEDPRVRREAVRSLTARGATGDALEELLELVADDDEDVASAAIRALGTVGSPRAEDALGRVASWWRRPRQPRSLRKLAKQVLREEQAA